MESLLEHGANLLTCLTHKRESPAPAAASVLQFFASPEGEIVMQDLRGERHVHSHGFGLEEVEVCMVLGKTFLHPKIIKAMEEFRSVVCEHGFGRDAWVASNCKRLVKTLLKISETALSAAAAAAAAAAAPPSRRKRWRSLDSPVQVQ